MTEIKFNEIFERGSKTFYNSSRFFPEDVRKDVYILYAFVRTVDNFVDEYPQKEDLFYSFRNEYFEGLRGVRSDNEIIAAFIELKIRRGFEDKWIESFFISMENDLKHIKYPNEVDTLDYIYGSASVIGLCMAKIMNIKKEGYKYAADLGNAFQYVNFVRDVDEDLSLKRNYFPNVDLKRYKIKEYTKGYLVKNPERFNHFLRYQIAKYRCWLKEAMEGFHYIPRRYRVAIKTATDIYNWTCNVIDKDPSIVFKEKVKPTKLRVILYGIKNLLFT